MISLSTYTSLAPVRHCSPYGSDASALSDNFVVQPADVVFVSALQCDRVLLDCSFSGVGSLKELIAAVGRAIGNATGLVTLHFRNRDRGCSLRRALRYRPSAPLFASA